MRFFKFLRPQPQIEAGWLDHPVFRQMSMRDLADLPMPRPEPLREPAVYRGKRAA